MPGRGDGHSLLLPAGKLMGVGTKAVGQANLSQQLKRFLLDLALRATVIPAVRCAIPCQ